MKFFERVCWTHVYVCMTNEQDLDKVRLAIADRRSVAIKIGPHRLKVYCDEKRSRFILCWYAGLKRERWETTDPAAALDMAREIIENYQGKKKLVQSVSQDRIQALIEADTALAGVRLETLVEHYKKFMEMQEISVGRLVEMYEASTLSAKKSAEHLRTVRSHLKTFRKSFSGSITAIKAADLDAYLDTIAHPKTRLNNRITICALFRYAQRKSFLPYGMTEAEKTERPQIDHAEPEILTRKELISLLNLCPDTRTLTHLLIGAFAGCRSAEISRLTWGDVREDCIILSSLKTKTRRRRIAEIPTNLKAWLEPLRGEPHELVTWPEEKDYLLYRKIALMRKNTNVSWTKNCLRHTFVSSHLELHRDAPRTAKTSGHSLAVLERDYLKLISREQAQAWFDIYPKDAPLALDLIDSKNKLSRPVKGAKRYLNKVLQKAALLSVKESETQTTQHHA